MKLLPTFEGFFAIDAVLEVQNVPISVERSAERMTILCGQKIQGMILKSVDYFSSDQPETEESGNHHTAPLHRRTVNAR